MPFRLITGTMGGGKSYYGAELCIKYWKEGAYVHTNMDMVLEEVEKRGWTDRLILLGTEPEEWDSHMIGGAEGQENLVIIDEAMCKFDSLDWQQNRKKYKQLMHFLTQSRKLGLDVFMIGQAQKGMDAQFSRISLEVINCTAVKHWPVIGPYMVTMRGDFCRTSKYPGGQRRGPATYHRLNMEIGSIYRTESTDGRFDNVERRVTRAPAASAKLGRVKAWGLLGVGLVTILIIMMLIRNAWVAWFIKPSKPADVAAGPATRPPTIQTPPLAEGAKPAVSSTSPPPPPPARFRPWGTADWGRLQFWEAVTGAHVIVGGIYDDAVVQALDMSGRIFKARLDDGRIVEWRPAARADVPVQKAQPKPKPSWNSLFPEPLSGSTL